MKGKQFSASRFSLAFSLLRGEFTVLCLEWDECIFQSKGSVYSTPYELPQTAVKTHYSSSTLTTILVFYLHIIHLLKYILHISIYPRKKFK